MWFPHLVNGGKYLASVSMIVMAYLRNTRPGYDTIYLMVGIFSTCYSCGWDFVMDWGLMRGTKSGTTLLRDRMKFPKEFYYFSMVTNLALRLTWLVAFIP
jgi:hypothetical protein